MSKPQGLDWQAITDNYVANGGELKPEVWGGKAAAKVSKPKTASVRKPRPDTGQPRRPRGSNGLKTELSREKLEELVIRYKAGESSLSLGRAYGLAANTVIRILREQGVEIRPRAEQVKLPDEQLDRAIQRYKFGCSIRQIADELGIVHSTLKRILTEAGVEFRTPSEAARMAWVAK